MKIGKKNSNFFFEKFAFCGLHSTYGAGTGTGTGTGTVTFQKWEPEP